MTTFEKIIAAIDAVNKANGTNYPHRPDQYNGQADHWYTYNYADDYGRDYADDEPQNIGVELQVHYFLPINEDFLKIKNQIREALHAQGFTYPEITIIPEQDTKIRQIVFSFSGTEEREV